MNPSSALFHALLFLTAFLYAAVGHGGASGYLALMALWNVPPEVMRPTALLLNLFVSLGSFLLFRAGKHFDRRLFLPLALASIPMSFLGGMLQIDAALYRKLLGLLLLFPIGRFLFLPNPATAKRRPPHTGLALLIGGTIGLLSGMIGIGGGILLSPVLLLLQWTDQKRTAAISALFIFVNSLSGLGGRAAAGLHFSHGMLGYVIAALAGGLIGAYLGAKRLPQTSLKYILAIVLSLASYKLLSMRA